MPCSQYRGGVLALLASLIVSVTAGGVETPLMGDRVEVTATRVPELIDNVPASITLVTGDEIRERGANDLRTALSLVAGVEGTPGGDSGPAGSVPAMWGLREADAFLLVVDSVPWGGAFNPATPSVDLAGVDRIEILRGAAPVVFGATSFVGVIHVMHFAPGRTPASIGVTAGSYGSAGITAISDLPAIGAYRQSVTANFEKRGYAQDRTQWRRYHALYRGTGEIGESRFHVDGDVSITQQQPPGNLLLRDGTTLHTELPLDANFNPGGAKIDQQRYHLVAGLDGKSTLGDWAATLAITRTLDTSLRGFLRGQAFTMPPDAGVGDGLQADGFSQKRGITDVYFDAHLTSRASSELNVTYGVDHLHGSGNEHAINFGYCVDPVGREYACDGAHHADEIVESSNKRDFSGLYAQLDYKLGSRLDVLAGLRLNHTEERAQGQAIDNTGPAPVVAFDGSDSGRHTRLSGVVGASWHAWASGRDAVTLYADYRNTFKPLATDFGPEAEVKVLQPETADSYEIGAKLQLLDGRLDIDASAFRMDFRNGLTYGDNGNGSFVPINGSHTRFQGAELEANYSIVPALQLTAHFASHDAKFVSFTAGNGADASGNRVEMSPRQLGGLGLVYSGRAGFSAALVTNYVGDRYLDKSNSVRAGGYGTVDASIGYRRGKYRIRLAGANLTDRRDPVSQSELQTVATVTRTAGYYRLSSRSAVISLEMAL